MIDKISVCFVRAVLGFADIFFRTLFAASKIYLLSFTMMNNNFDNAYATNWLVGQYIRYASCLTAYIINSSSGRQ